MGNAVISFFDTNGRFVQRLEGPWDMVLLPTIETKAIPYVEGAYDEKYWLYGGVARPRPDCPAMLDGLTLKGVRPGSTIIINNQSYDCPEGGDVELEFDQPGIYQVRVVRWPYLDGEFEIENPAQ